METRDINQINSKINNLKNEYTKELNTVNHYYWPLIAASEKKYGNLKWYLTLSICLEAAIIICLLFFEVTNPYWIVGFNVIGVAIMTLVAIFFKRHKKRHLKLKKEWDNALIPSNKLKDELTNEMNVGAEMMLTFFKENYDNDIKDEIGTSYEDVLSYYSHWVDNN